MWIPDAFDVDYSAVAANEYIEAGINLTIVGKVSSDNKKYRVNCNDTIMDMLHWESDETGKITVQPKLKIYKRCHKLIETLPSLQIDDNNVEDIADKQYDHPYDSLKYLIMALVKPREIIPDTRPQWLKDLSKNKKKSRRQQTYMEV